MADYTSTLLIVAGPILTLVLAEGFRRWKSAYDRRAAAAAVRKTEGDADLTASQALAGAFTTITESLRIIHDLRTQLATVEADLQRALATVQGLSAENSRLSAERLADKARLDQAHGEIRQLKQVASSAERARP